MTKNVVEIRGLDRQFGDKYALKGINFQAAEGMIYGLVGVNGAGKTTLIKHCLGLLRAMNGSVEVFGLDPVRNPVEVLGRIGYLSEDRDLPEWMTVAELLDYTRAYHPRWDEQYARQLLRSFNLDQNKKVKELSKGMRAQAGLVAAVAHRPELLILDEPSSGLDAVVREDILDAIVRTISDEGRTVIFSSHLLEEVERMSDHITMIHEGQITLDDSLDAIRESWQISTVRYPDNLAAAPLIEGALAVEGNGRSWNVIHPNSLEQLKTALAVQDGELVQSRQATLQEIFIARVGRERYGAEAA